MVKWNVYRTTPIGVLVAKDRPTALEQATKLWGVDVRVQSVASVEVQQHDFAIARKRKFPNKYTDYHGGGPDAA